VKKIVLFSAALILLVSGCAVKYTLKNEFPGNYAYDRLYSAAMLALNDANFGVTEHDRQNGIIKAQDLSNVYYDWNAGVFIVLPWVSAVDRHPLITVLLIKGSDKTVMSAAGTFSSSQKNILPQFLEKTIYYYDNFDKAPVVINPAQAAAATVQDAQQITKTAAVALKAAVNWDNSRGVTVRNEESRAWADLTISMVYSSMFETKVFSYSAGTLKPGEGVTLKNSLFKDEGGGGIKRNDRPSKITLNCRLEGGQAGEFESR
jgi:hypothetical protein